MSKGERPKVLFSSANVADPRFRALHYVSPRKIGEFAAATGYEGVELMIGPFDWLATPGAIARAVRSGKLQLEALHASVRPSRAEGAQGGRSLTSRVMASPLGRVVLPTAANSTYRMRQVQMLLKTEVPKVMYRQSDATVEARMHAQAGAGKRLIQVTDKLAADIEARTAEEVVEKLVENGPYDGFIADTAHMHPLRYGGSLPGVISNLRQSQPVLGKYIHGMHVATGRLDSAPNDAMRRETANDLRNALKGRFEGPTGDIMAACWEARNCEYASIETPAQSLRTIAGAHTKTDFMLRYTELAHGVQNYYIPEW